MEALYANGTQTVFVYDAWGVLAAEYSTVGASAQGTQYVVGADLESTRLAMTGSPATASERHDYQPFGYEMRQYGGTWRQGVPGYGVNTIRQKFTGQERDNETNLDYFLARYFAAAQGRFTSPDPGNEGSDPTDPQSWNGYAYVSNNSLAYTDPMGLGEGGNR